jgi:FtsH-binding integral membrane protein
MGEELGGPGVIRVLVGLAGVAAMGWGLWLVRDDGFERWRSQVVWFVGGVLAHDAILAPVVVVVGVVAARILRPTIRPAIAFGFIVWATVTVAVANVLLPIGGRPDNPSLMDRPYVLAWVAFTAVVVALVSTYVLVARRRPVDSPSAHAAERP